MANNKYVVVSDAAMVTTGKKENGRPEYTRVLRGGTVNGPAESEQIKTLLTLGAIKQVKSKDELAEIQADLARGVNSRHRQTAKKAARAAGLANNDPALEADPAFAPLSAPMPETSPDAILADDGADA